MEAYRIARNEGFKGQQADERMQQILLLDKMPDFLKQAQDEGYTGATARARAVELREQMREARINEAGSEFASEATYNHSPHGLLGVLSGAIEKAIGGLADRSPLAGLVARTIIPFTRIVANVTNRGLNYTPYGYKRAFFGYTGEGKLTPDQKAAALARANLGMVGLGTLGALMSQGAIEVHGAGPSDADKKKQLLSTGWKPYSIKVGDSYLNYTYTPIGLMLSMLGNYMDSQRYGELDNKDALTRATYAVSRLGSTVFNQSFLSGLSGLFDALSDDPKKAVSGIRNWIARTTGAYTTPNILRDVKNVFDPTIYSSEGVAQDLIRNTPFAGLALEPVLNAFGEPVTPPRQRFISRQSQDPAWQLVARKGLRISVPSRTTESEPESGKPLSQKQYYAYLKQGGQALKKWVTENAEALDAMPSEQAQDAMDQAARAIRANILPKIRAMK